MDPQTQKEILSLLNIVPLLNLLALVFLSITGRNWVNRKHEEIKSLYSKKEIIYRMRVEKEFDILQNLWRKLFALKESTNRLIENHQIPSLIGNDRKKEIIKKYQRDFSEAAAVINNNIPFYNKEVYELASEIVKSVEKVDLSIVQKFEHEGIEELEVRLKIIIETIEQIESAIRRIY